MIIVHHLENSRSHRILWLLEELGLSYEIKNYKRDKVNLLAPAELKKVHPLGKSPVITDGEKVLAESGAIIDYLVRKYGNGKLIPKSEDDLIRFNYWLHYAEGSLMTPFLVRLIFDRIENSPMPFFIKFIARQISGKVKSSWINPQIKLHLDYLEDEIGKTGHFAGNEFSAADIMMTYPLEAANARGGLKRPRLEAFLKKMENRSAYKKAIERGGPFQVIPVASEK